VNNSLQETGSETDKKAARVRPAGTDVQTDLDRPTGPMATNPGPFQDIPKGIWIIFLSAWASLFTLFILFFTVTPAAAFAVTIATLFGLMAFGLPAVMAAQGRCEGHQCRGMVHTRTGPLSVAAAGTQIVLIPVAAVIGLTAFVVLAL
jgi:hypothetical protein